MRLEIPLYKVPTIYVYTLKSYKNRVWQGVRKGKGLLCVGYTEQEDEQDRGAKERL